MCTTTLKLLLRFSCLVWLLLFSLSCQKKANEAFSSEQLSAVLPYSFQDTPINIAAEATKADILLIGGKEASELGAALAPLMEEKGFNFYSLTYSGLSMVRLYQIFKTHKMHPKIILYLPDRDEEQERYFLTEEAELVKHNLSKYQKSWWQLLHRFLPKLAKASLKKITQVQVAAEPTKDFTTLTDGQKISRSLTVSALFSVLANDWIKNLTAKIVFITTPIDPMIAPRNCRMDIRWPVKTFLQEQRQSIAAQDWKKALEDNDQLKKVGPFYAETYYLRSKIHRQKGELDMAYGMLQLSSLLDCQLPGVALRNLLLNNLQQDFPSQIALMDYSQFLAMACFKEPSQCESENNANSTMLQAAATALMLMVETILK